MSNKSMTKTLLRIEGKGMLADHLVVDGDKMYSRWYGANAKEPIITDIPEYLHPTEGYIHMHRIINAMGKSAVWDYVVELERICGSKLIEQATVFQMAQAILRAEGKRED